MNIAIIYHDADFDGKLSNEVCLHWLSKLHPDAEVDSYGWDYGRPLPRVLPLDEPPTLTPPQDWADYDQIYIVDLSVDELMARPELREKIVWIDHHASAIKQWDDNDGWTHEPAGMDSFGGKYNEFWRREHETRTTAPITPFIGYRIDGVAACRLCWQWFRMACLQHTMLPRKEEFVDRVIEEPELIRLAGEYDVWDHRDPAAKALQFGLRTVTDLQWQNFIASQFAGEGPDQACILKDLIELGEDIKSYCDKQNDEYSAAFSHTIQFAGLTFLALNIGQRGNSDLLRGGIKPEHQAGFAWRWDGKQAYCSLYHLPGHEQHDLSVIAKRWGGGGHKGACGFRTTLIELDQILHGVYENMEE